MNIQALVKTCQFLFQINFSKIDEKLGRKHHLRERFWHDVTQLLNIFPDRPTAGRILTKLSNFKVMPTWPNIYVILNTTGLIFSKILLFLTNFGGDIQIKSFCLSRKVKALEIFKTIFSYPLRH